MRDFKTFLRHAFGFRAIGPIAVTALNGWMALADRHMTIDDPRFWAVVIVGVGGGILSWAVIAYDSFANNRESLQLLSTIRGLEISVKALTPTTSVNLRNLGCMSSRQLKELIARSAAELRVFNTQARMEQSKIFGSLRCLVPASGGSGRR